MLVDRTANDPAVIKSRFAKLKNIYDGLQKRLDDWVPYTDKKNNVHITKHLIDEQIGTWLLDSYTRE